MEGLALRPEAAVLAAMIDRIVIHKAAVETRSWTPTASRIIGPSEVTMSRSSPFSAARAVFDCQRSDAQPGDAGGTAADQNSQVKMPSRVWPPMAIRTGDCRGMRLCQCQLGGRCDLAGEPSRVRRVRDHDRGTPKRPFAPGARAPHAERAAALAADSTRCGRTARHADVVTSVYETSPRPESFLTLGPRWDRSGLSHRNPYHGGFSVGAALEVGGQDGCPSHSIASQSRAGDGEQAGEGRSRSRGFSEHFAYRVLNRSATAEWAASCRPTRGTRRELFGWNSSVMPHERLTGHRRLLSASLRGRQASGVSKKLTDPAAVARIVALLTLPGGRRAF